MIYHTSSNSIGNPDVQNNQFCYDRNSVSMYGSGPGDPQDARSMPPNNSAGHQMGGKSCDLLMSCDHRYIIIPPQPKLVISSYKKCNQQQKCYCTRRSSRKRSPSHLTGACRAHITYPITHRINRTPTTVICT